MIHSPQKLWLLITVCAAFAWSRAARPADMSAQMGALVHDVTAPYAEDHYPVSAKDREAYQKAREILRKEHFLGTARPATGAADLSAPYGKALALGTSVNKVLPQIAELHGAALHNDKAGMQSIIGAIYENIGRKVPQGDAMQKLIEAARRTAIAEGVSNEEFTVKKPGYEIRNKYSPGSGTVQTDVRTTGDKGEPVRARFAGDLKGKPAPNGKDVQLVAQPEDKPKIVDSVESKKLVVQIPGDWIDDDGKPWKIELQGSAITLTSRGLNDHPIVYKGTYDLAQIRAEHKVDHPDDMLEDMPGQVKAELASSYHPPFNVDLEVSEGSDELKGTWTSLNVTYDGMTQSVSSVHDPFDRALVLRRKLTSGIALGMKDGDFP